MTNVIYLIRCAVSPKVYVGSTKHFVRRRFHHLSLLRSGRHHCLNLQRAFKKYGEATFSFDVVEHVEDPNFLHAREQFWLWRREGARFNSYPSAASPLRVKLTAKRRAQISVQLRGNTHRRGKKGSAAECLAKSIASMGNQHRLGILHSPADRNKIGAGLVRAYADGRHERPDLEMSRLNISKWNKALQAGKNKVGMRSS
jgi:group I intron endonuclease